MKKIIRNYEVEDIHESLINGQCRQMVEQIDDYGPADFWPDYRYFLADDAGTPANAFRWFTDATISYFRIKGR